MKKFAKIIVLLLVVIIIVALFASCDENKHPIDISKDDKSTHYLVFKQNGNEIFRMVVLEGETYKDLRPFFPTLPEDNQNRYYWPEDASVWSDKESVQVINAVIESID